MLCNEKYFSLYLIGGFQLYVIEHIKGNMSYGWHVHLSLACLVWCSPRYVPGPPPAHSVKHCV